MSSSVTLLCQPESSNKHRLQLVDICPKVVTKMSSSIQTSDDCSVISSGVSRITISNPTVISSSSGDVITSTNYHRRQQIPNSHHQVSPPPSSSPSAVVDHRHHHYAEPSTLIAPRMKSFGKTPADVIAEKYDQPMTVVLTNQSHTPQMLTTLSNLRNSRHSSRGSRKSSSSKLLKSAKSTSAISNMVDNVDTSASDDHYSELRSSSATPPPTPAILDESDLLQIELSFKAHKTFVYVGHCMANLYFTKTDLINGGRVSSPRSHEWELARTGIPVIIFDKGETRSRDRRQLQVSRWLTILSTKCRLSTC